MGHDGVEVDLVPVDECVANVVNLELSATFGHLDGFDRMGPDV